MQYSVWIVNTPLLFRTPLYQDFYFSIKSFVYINIYIVIIITRITYCINYDINMYCQIVH